MKRIDILKKLLCVTLVASTGVVNAQVKALSFGGTTLTNYYANYVGVRVGVTDPTGNPTIGDKQYTITNTGAAGGWAAAVTIPIVDVDIAMVAAGGDTVVSGSLAPGSMLGKIAFIYRGTSEFGHKAAQAKIAGAIACVIVNNIPGGPVGMGAGAEGGAMATVQSLPLTGGASGIPVVMISKEQGDAIDVQYRNGVAIKMTLTNWGAGKTNDIGFVPGGAAMWHAYAVPADQLTTGSPLAYMAVDGAFIANYGSTTATAVNLTSQLTFTPTGGSASSLHTSTVTLGNFAVADSVIAMFDTLSTATNVYSLPAGTGTGRYDQNFTLNTTTDDYIGDNTTTTSFYATDSLYSKGRYDFANLKPFSTEYSGRSTAADVIWGNMYFVNKGGAAVRNVQYSFSMNTTTAHTLIDAGSTNAYVFKWVDGNSDGVLQNGELTLVGLANHNYDVTSSSTGDTSGGVFSATEWKPDNTPGELDYVKLEDNTWYYVAVQVPSGYYVGCDGVLDQYPRIYGRRYNKTGGSAHGTISTDAFLEYSNLNYTGSDTSAIVGAPADNNLLMPYINENIIAAVDSFNYNQTKGLIPSVSMTVNKAPVPIDHSKDAVNNVNKTTIGASVYPNPATNNIVVSLDLDKTAPVVSYTIIDGLARIVGKETSNNVKSEKHTINTSKLPAGNYDLIINANGAAIVKKFTIIK